MPGLARTKCKCVHTYLLLIMCSDLTARTHSFGTDIGPIHDAVPTPPPTFGPSHLFDPCHGHITNKTCNPQLWSPMTNKKHDQKNGKQCYVDMGHSAEFNTRQKPKDVGTNKNSETLNTIMKSGVTTEINKLSTFFGLQVTLESLNELCVDVFEEYARSAQYGQQQTICGHIFPSWNGLTGNRCTEAEPCTKEHWYQVAHCSSLHPGEELFAILTACTTSCMYDTNRKGEKCCYVPPAFKDMFKCCESRHCCDAHRRLQSGSTVAVAVSRPSEESVGRSGTYSSLLDCIQNGGGKYDANYCISQPWG